MSQPMYHCRIFKVYICQSCAFLCLKGHPLNFIGVESNASCQCFNKANCCCTFRKDVVCSYEFFGKDLIYQPWYKCFTCGTRQNEGYCAIFAKKCNHDHDIYCKGFIEHYCECGANAFKTECKTLKFPLFNYLSSCTNREPKCQSMKQRLYHCKTCGISAQNQGICEACALFCNPGLKVVFLGTSEFVCECITMNESAAVACLNFRQTENAVGQKTQFSRLSYAWHVIQKVKGNSASHAHSFATRGTIFIS